jgi:hypothetical protein
MVQSKLALDEQAVKQAENDLKKTEGYLSI